MSLVLPTGYRPMTIAGGVRAAAARGPDRVALRLGERSRSYGELMRRIDRVTNATIADLHLSPGDHVAIVAASSFEYLEIVCGVPEAGVAVATINAKLAVAELVDACDDACARVLFADAASCRLLRDARFATVQLVIEFGAPYESWLENAAASVPRPVVQEWDVWAIPYTSGTTGRPKGVQLPHRARALVGLLSQTEFGCFGPQDRFLAVSPMNHGAGIGFPLACLLGGGCVDIMERFDAATLLQRMCDNRITGTFMVPTHFQAVFALPPAVLEAHRPTALRAIIANAAPLSMKLKRRIVAYFGDDVLYEIYGSTESGLVSSLPPRFQLSHAACVGLPFAHTELRVLDTQGQECLPGEVGEVWSRSPCCFSGYWNRPADTEAAFRDGWLSVGDMGRRDADGFLYLVDRKHDVVITGGTNVYPREIEDVLLRHAAVDEVAVVGVADDTWGERLKAFVVLQPGASLSQQELEDFCGPYLARFKIPRQLTILAQLPRNANGKILKRDLRNVSPDIGDD